MYIHLGWPVSPYSAKTRAYFQYKAIPFTDKEPSLPTLLYKVKRAVGHSVMPTVITPQKTWWQDSTDIIENLEREFPTPRIHPEGPKQQLVSLLFELFADEWLPMVSLHFRWNLPDNRRFAMEEFGHYGFKVLPKQAGRWLADRLAGKRMRSYLPLVGISEATIPGIEAFAQRLLANLDTHFSHHAFLVGERPCLGDFALFGQLWAHLYRDPETTPMFAPYRHLQAWLASLQAPSQSNGEFLTNDQIPTTLLPILTDVVRDMFPYITNVITATDRYVNDNPGSVRVPRNLGRTEFSIGDCRGKRAMLSYVQWMAQRPLHHYQHLSDSQRRDVDELLTKLGPDEAAHTFLRQTIRNPLIKKNYKCVLEQPS